ncbi:MAG: PhoU domain-containing protein [Sinobacteraceae bacterium]|nr:PhoU domain-containing protein [Nevskiaceae bacterium]
MAVDEGSEIEGHISRAFDGDLPRCPPSRDPGDQHGAAVAGRARLHRCRALQAAFVSKSLERIGDHARDVARLVGSMGQGRSPPPRFSPCPAAAR